MRVISAASSIRAWCSCRALRRVRPTSCSIGAGVAIPFLLANCDRIASIRLPLSRHGRNCTCAERLAPQWARLAEEKGEFAAGRLGGGAPRHEGFPNERSEGAAEGSGPGGRAI